MKFGVIATALSLLFSLLAGCAAPVKMTKAPREEASSTVGAREERITIGGGDAALTGLILPVKETYEEENGTQLVMMQSRPGTELVDLQQGRVDGVVSAVPVEDLIMGAAREQVIIDRNALREVRIGNSRSVIFLNKGVRLERLSTKQLKEIFTGRITNWKKVGGPNRPIAVVWNPGAVGENDSFIREILQGEPVVKNFHPAANAEELRKKVMETPGSIGIGINALKAPGVRVPESPTHDSTVVLVTKKEPSPALQKLIDLLVDTEFLQ